MPKFFVSVYMVTMYFKIFSVLFDLSCPSDTIDYADSVEIVNWSDTTILKCSGRGERSESLVLKLVAPPVSAIFILSTCTLHPPPPPGLADLHPHPQLVDPRQRD